MSQARRRRKRYARKAELIALVLELWDHGLESPTLIAELLAVSKGYVGDILALHNRRAKPRHSVADTLAGLPPDLRARVTAAQALELAQRTPFVETPAGSAQEA